jgi:ABC-type oligopeptide transport system substrate-binding subunit
VADGQSGTSTFDSLKPFTIKRQGARVCLRKPAGALPDEPFTAIHRRDGESRPTGHHSICGSSALLRRPADHGRRRRASLALLKEKGLPYHRSYYRKVVEANVLDRHTVRFVFDTTGDRELPLIMGLMPVLPRHRYTLETFDRSTLEPPIGSGPYVVASVDPGRAITYRRNPTTGRSST